MTDLGQWVRDMRPTDMTVDGLARLEARVLIDYPQALRSISQIVDEFAPVAREIERRHGGRALMTQVEARQTQDWRKSPNAVLAVVSFLIVALPAFSWAITTRASWGYLEVVTTAAVSMGVTATLCLIKLLTTRNDSVWVGTSPRWALGAAGASVAAATFTLYGRILLPEYDAGVAVGIICVSAIIVVVFAALSILRTVRTTRRQRADLEPIHGAVTAYLAEFRPRYQESLAQIGAVIAKLDPKDSVSRRIATKLLNKRNAYMNTLSSNRGLYRGHVPLDVTRKKLGELQLFAVAEPLLGGGPYPVYSKPSKFPGDQI